MEEQQNPLLSVVLITYNERENILHLVPRIDKILKENSIDAEILVVDDTSPDGTADAAKELNKEFGNIRVVLRPNKEGMGAALIEGYNESKGRYIISFDVDSIDPKIIIPFIDMLKNQCDLVCGSRHLKGGVYEKKMFKTYVKNMISTVGNKIIRTLLNIPIHDFSLNCRGMKKECWDQISCIEKGNAWMLEMIYLSARKNFSIKEYPVEFKDRVFGESKLSFAKQVPKFFMTTLKLRFRR